MEQNIELKAKAQKIKLIAFDVDGVMTDNSLYFDENGAEYKRFNGKDGQGIELLRKAGLLTAIISKRNNGTITTRAKVLKIDELHIGAENKIEVLDEILKNRNLKYEQVAYMGDDLPDICILEKVGLACSPADGVDEVKANADFISTRRGGDGAVRELCEFILRVQGHNDLRKLLES